MSHIGLPDTNIAQPRIIGPGNGAVLALEPDIPAGKQLVRFAARTARPELKWQTGDHTPAPSVNVSELRWMPTPGQHVVRLLDENGMLLDEIRLFVHGAVRVIDSVPK